MNSSLGVGSETKNGQTTYYTRTPSGHLVSERTAAGSYYYLFDGLGSVVGLVDPLGNLAARYGYDPYRQQCDHTDQSRSRGNRADPIILSLPVIHSMPYAIGNGDRG